MSEPIDYRSGDDFTRDMEGANRCGIPAVWLRPGRRLETGDARQTISDLAELPGVLQA